MADENLRAEIESLREQLSTLKKEREAAAESRESDLETPPNEEPESTDAVEEASGEEGEEQHDLAAQFHELLDSLDKDLRETKPSTLLIVFALGVLVGRISR